MIGYKVNNLIERLLIGKNIILFQYEKLKSELGLFCDNVM